MMKKTLLYEKHKALGAKMVSFAGWEMPVSYKGVIAEHLAVRRAVGLFDISHMGIITIEGEGAEAFLNKLSTNQIAGKPSGVATYTVWCQENGGCVDDVIIYRRNSCAFFVIVNASNRQKDLNHLLSHRSSPSIEVQLHEQWMILALQGPHAESLLARFIPEVKTLKPMHFLEQERLVLDFANDALVIARTGYTGAGGFELYGPSEKVLPWWDRLLQEGKSFGIEPVGLGARDTLRLEMGYALYGHEISEEIAPTESVAAWTVKWQKDNFIGKAALEKLEQNKAKRAAYGIRLLDPGIARESAPIFKGDTHIGTVTSGSFSPILNQAIALILANAPLEIGEEIVVQVRQQKCRAQVVHLPFIKAEKSA